MSNEQLIIEERSRDIGDFMVGRLLPFRKKRMVGPFIFVDHMGPTEVPANRAMDIDQHPHIGLATLTYLLSGEVMHKDSIGTEQRIRPGAINLMIAGKGVTHTERTPDDLRGTAYTMEGYQIWIALPKEMEDMDPEFYHIAADDLQSWEEGGISFRLVAGKAFGKTARLELWSDMFMLELEADEDRDIDLSGQLKGEIGIVINKGAVSACDEKIDAGNLLVAKEEEFCKIKVHAGSRIFIIGGRPFEEKRFIDWNFVHSDKAVLDKAIEDWKNHTFPKVPGDNTYVPYPDLKR